VASLHDATPPLPIPHTPPPGPAAQTGPEARGGVNNDQTRNQVESKKKIVRKKSKHQLCQNEELKRCDVVFELNAVVGRWALGTLSRTMLSGFMSLGWGIPAMGDPNGGTGAGTTARAEGGCAGGRWGQ